MAVLYIEDYFITHFDYINAIYEEFPGSKWVGNLSDAREALNSKNDFDVILCDSKLTQEGFTSSEERATAGINFLRSLYQEQKPDGPILILFSVFTEQLQLHINKASGIYVLNKPIDSQTLVEQIKELLKQIKGTGPTILK